MPVTENVTGEPVSPAEPAVTVFAPAVVPSVQVVNVAWPLTSVWMVAGDVGEMEPLPAVTVNVTLTPATGLLCASVTRTDGAVTEVPTVAEAGGVLAELMTAAEPVVPVAVNVTGLPPPVNPVAVAVIELGPTVLPRIHEPIVAIPDELVVVGFVPVSDPLPVTTAKVTVTPETGLLLTSVTRTEGAMATELPAVADCPSPALIDIFAAPPTVPVAVKVTGLPPPANPVAVAVIVFAPATVPSVH